MMKTYVHFDALGSIHSIITVDAPAGVMAMMEPEPGLSVAEIDAPELDSAAGDVEKTREMAKSYKVDMSAGSRYKLSKA